MYRLINWFNVRGSQDDGKADVGAGNAGNDTNSFGWDFSGDCSVANMSALDLSKYPGFASLPYSKVELLKGDCLYIPASWCVPSYRLARILTRVRVCVHVRAYFNFGASTISLLVFGY